MRANDSAAVTENENLADRLITHFKAVFAQATVENEPFQHFYLEGVFPNDVYERLLTCLPSEESKYKAFNPKRYKDSQGRPTRKTIVLDEEGLAIIEPENRRFWSDVATAITSESFRSIVYEKFMNDISIRLGCAPSEVFDQPVKPQCKLIRDVEGYRIKPHPDGYQSVVTMVFYLPQDLDHQDLGTSLYIEQGIVARLLGRRFKEVQRFPYRPNSVGAFANNDNKTRKSLHGRELVGARTGIRHVMIARWLREPQNK
jgi:hypothetical protein